MWGLCMNLRGMSECIIKADLQQVIINKQNLHVAYQWKDKQFFTVAPLRRSHEKPEDVSFFLCMQMGREL